MPNGTVLHDDDAAMSVEATDATSGSLTPVERRSELSTSAPAFPPPPPPSASPADSSTSRVTGLLALLAVAGLALGAVMTVLWLGARGDGDIEAERDTALEQLDLAESRLTGVETRLADSDDAMIRTQQLLDEARLDLAAAEEALLDAPSADDVAQVDALQAQVEGFEASSVESAAEIARLEAELADALAVDPVEAGTAAFDPATAPAFSRYVGELLSSRTGSSRLGQDASTCFGAAVIDLIGLDALGAGQNNVATTATRNAVVGAMQEATAICNIDPALVFG